MKTTYIIDAIRTPLGNFGGALATTRVDDLGASVSLYTSDAADD